MLTTEQHHTLDHLSLKYPEARVVRVIEVPVLRLRDDSHLLVFPSGEARKPYRAPDLSLNGRPA